MDLDHLESALQNIQLNMESVHSVAQYCVNNNVNSEPQIVKMVQKHFHLQSNIHRKTAIFLLISEIFYLASIKKIKGFFKHFAGKLKSFMEVLAVEAVDDVQLASWIIGALDNWSKGEYFVQNFLEKIREAARPLLKKLEEQKSGQNDKYTKYKKTFLMEVLDLKNFEPTNHLYKAYVLMHELSHKLNNFQGAYNKLNLEHTDEDTLKRGAELLRSADQLPLRLEKVICMYHEGFKMLTEECKKDLEQISRGNE